MKRHWMVGIREIHVRFYSVHAQNEEEAKDLVHQRAPCVVDENFLEYANEMDRDTWSVEEIPENTSSQKQEKKP